MPVGIFTVRRAKDGKVITKETEYKVLKDACFGYDLFFNNKQLTGYTVKDKDTGELLVSKGTL